MQQALEQSWATESELRLRVQQAIKLCERKKIRKKLRYYKAIVESGLWLGWEFRFLIPHCKRNSNSVFDSKDSGRFVFWNSDVWRDRKSEFWFAIFGIPVISLRRNSVHLILANLYWLQSMYNDLILIVHKLVAPLQHQTADQHHVISWHHQCNSCH